MNAVEVGEAESRMLSAREIGLASGNPTWCRSLGLGFSDVVKGDSSVVMTPSDKHMCSSVLKSTPIDRS